MTAVLDSTRNTQAQSAIHTAETREPIRPPSITPVAAQRPSRPHIGTITATVRVLTIGTHQMTLGMLKQLDVLPAADIEQPLGRVRTRPQASTEIEIVGITTKGALAAAIVRPPSWVGAGSADLDHWAHHWRPDLIGRTLSVGRYDGSRRLTWRVDAFAHPTLNPVRGETCGRSSLEDLWREQARAELAEVTAAQNAYDSAKRLPLILLPGVR